MRILLTTGIYPPQIGGPAKYAAELAKALASFGHIVTIKRYGKFERMLPPGVRHIFFAVKILPEVVLSDGIITLDTFSVGLPTVFVAKLFGKKVILRTGGDFLWEAFVERSGCRVILRDFYKVALPKLSIKEKLIFLLIGWTLRNASLVAFSTGWQRDIFEKPYGVDKSKTVIIENCFWPKGGGIEPDLEKKIFIGSTRKLRWKNLDTLQSAFEKAREENHSIYLDLENTTPNKFEEKLRTCYAVALVSLGDISPNMILEAIRFGKPFILTREHGLGEKVSNIALLVNPLDEKDITEKILWLANEANYKVQKAKVDSFNFVRTYKDIARDFLSLFEKLKCSTV